MMDELGGDIDSFIIPKYTTLMDLQAYAVVKERLSDAKNSISDARLEILDIENESIDVSDNALNSLSYAYERFNTAKSWSKFITHHGTNFNLDDNSLKKACEEKIQESQELKQYVDLYIPLSAFTTNKDSLDDATDEYYDEEYVLCIFSASKSKSESSMILTSLGLGQNDAKEMTAVKLDVVKEIMNENKNSFPIVAYSYYEYAKALNDINDSASALLYSEYALDLASMNLYFSGDINRETFYFSNDVKRGLSEGAAPSTSLDTLYAFILGAMLGILFMIFLNQRKHEESIKKEHDLYMKLKRK